MRTQEALYIEHLRRVSPKNLYLFDRDVLGYREMRPNPHQQLCSFVENWDGKRKKLILLPRGTFKTSCVTIGYTIQQLLPDNHPNWRVLIASETLGQASKYLREMKAHYERNKLFRATFGGLTGDKWADDEFDLRRKNLGKKEPSVSAAGIGVVKVGQHYDLIILDDPHSQKNTTTRDRIEEVKDFLKLILSLLEPGGLLIVIGTRWHYGDTYGWILEEDRKREESGEKAQFATLIEKAIREDGTLYFPERLTPEFLKDQRDIQEGYIFSCQYLNDPIDDEHAIFKKSWIKKYKTPPKLLNRFSVIDPAISQQRSGDYTGLVTAGVDQQGFVYILEARRERLNPKQIIDQIFQIDETYQPGVIGIEEVGFQKTLKFFFREECRKRRKFPPVHGLKPDSNISKEMRISRLEPYYRAGRVFQRKDMSELEDELLRFPKGAYDDLIDGLSYMVPWWTRVPKEKPGKIPEGTIAHLLAKLNRKAEMRRRWIGQAEKDPMGLTADV